MIELCCEYLFVWCNWLYVIIMSQTSCGVNPHSIVCLNIKELLAWSRCIIWSLSDSKLIWTHNHLVHKWMLNYLAKLAKWLSCVVSTCMDGAFDCMLLSCHVQVSEWNECQGTCLKQEFLCLLWARSSVTFRQTIQGFPHVLWTWGTRGGAQVKTWGELKMLSKNTCEGVYLIVKLPGISLQASKFTKNELLQTYFSRILARF